MGVDDPALGGWGNDRAELISMPVEGVGLYADQPELIDFQAMALQLIAKAATKSVAKNLGPAYFILADSDMFARVRSRAVSVPLLRSDDSVRFFGKLWFVPRSLGHGFAIDTCGLSPAEVFELIGTLGGGHRPAIVVDPTQLTEAMVYPRGLDQAEHCEPFDLTVTNVNAEAVDQSLQGLYSMIRSPDQSAERPLWSDASKWWPVKDAEKAVQHEVTRALAGRFGWMMDVRSEQPSSIGRTDVELIQFRGLPAGQNIRHVLIELKVLRSFSSTGRPIRPPVLTRHISQGVRQASEYGKAANSKIRMLCCFDMRNDDAGTEVVFKDFKKPAQERGVLLRRYYLYNSSQALREALDSERVAAGATALPG